MIASFGRKKVRWKSLGGMDSGSSSNVWQLQAHVCSYLNFDRLEKEIV